MYSPFKEKYTNSRPQYFYKEGFAQIGNPPCAKNAGGFPI